MLTHAMHETYKLICRVLLSGEIACVTLITYLYPNMAANPRRSLEEKDISKASGKITHIIASCGTREVVPYELYSNWDKLILYH